MNNVKAWAVLAGVVLIAVGLLGVVANPLVGSAEGAVVPTDALHNTVHLASGTLALFIAFGPSGKTQIDAMFGFGVLYLVIFAAVLISATLFGLFQAPANAVLHVIHAGLAVGSLGVASMSHPAVATRV